MNEQVTFRFEISGDKTPEELHEIFCKAIHERDPQSLTYLHMETINIEKIDRLRILPKYKPFK